MENCRKEEKENGMTRIYSSLRASLKDFFNYWVSVQNFSFEFGRFFFEVEKLWRVENDL